MVDTFTGETVVHIGCGTAHTLVAVRGASSDLFAFGNNADGQLGFGNTRSCNLPEKIALISGMPLAAVFCGGQHNVIVTARRQYFTWGWNQYGQLGTGMARGASWRMTVPHEVASLSHRNIRQIALGYAHTVLHVTGEDKYDQNGRLLPQLREVYSFGRNNHGQLGLGIVSGISDGYAVTSPKPIKAFSGCQVIGISAGEYHTVVMTRSDRGVDTVWSFGRNDRGQLGLQDAEDRAQPEQVVGLWDEQEPKPGLAQIQCGYYHTLSSSFQGDLRSFGQNNNNAFGQGFGKGYEQFTAEAAEVCSLSPGLRVATLTCSTHVVLFKSSARTHNIDSFVTVPLGDDETNAADFEEEHDGDTHPAGLFRVAEKNVESSDSDDSDEEEEEELDFDTAELTQRVPACQGQFGQAWKAVLGELPPARTIDPITGQHAHEPENAGRSETEIVSLNGEFVVARGSFIVAKRFDCTSITGSANLDKTKFTTAVQRNIINTDEARSALQQLRRELHALNEGIGGTHRNLTQIYGAGFIRAAGIKYSPFVTERRFIEDACLMVDMASLGSVRYLLDYQREFSLAVRIRLLRGVLQAMVFLHTRKPPVLHGDLRCANVLAHDTNVTETMTSDCWEARVTDYGQLNARLQRSNMQPKRELMTKQTGDANCSFSQLTYLAPECVLTTGNGRTYRWWFAQDKQSPSTDVYSFAFVVWEIMTAETPWAGVSPEKLVYMVQQGKRPLLKNVPVFFAHLIETCWAQDPAERPTFPQLVKEFDMVEEWCKRANIAFTEVPTAPVKLAPE
jgi:hypothetical protein